MKVNTKSLENDYNVEVDTVEKSEWYKIIEQFSDSNIYQTWAYDDIRCGEDQISHLILKRNDDIVSVAQIQILMIPIFQLGAAYVRWGPLWKRKYYPEDPNVFRMALRALRNEYVLRRGLILRIYPFLLSNCSQSFQNIILQELYLPTYNELPQRTLIVSLQPKIEEIRKNFHQKWRNCLNKAERNKLQIYEGEDEKLFNDFIGIYKQLLKRKMFNEPNDINEFKKIQKALPRKFKFCIFICKDGEKLTSGAICSAIGDSGVYLFGATNKEGMKNKGSYLIQWNVIKWMKSNGCKFYNLNGINPESNPGTYHFKKGIAGKCGNDLNYFGRFDSYFGILSTLLIKTAKYGFPIAKKIKGYLK